MAFEVNVGARLLGSPSVGACPWVKLCGQGAGKFSSHEVSPPLTPPFSGILLSLILVIENLEGHI